MVNIHIDGYYPFESRIIYYGKGTRNEYRITRFLTNSPFEKEQQVGNLIVFIPLDHENFKVYIFNTEEEIETFEDKFSLTLINNNAVYIEGEKRDVDLSNKIEMLINEKASKYESFP